MSKIILKDWETEKEHHFDNEEDAYSYALGKLIMKHVMMLNKETLGQLAKRLGFEVIEDKN